MKYLLEYEEYLNEKYYTIGWYDDKTKDNIEKGKVFKQGKSYNYSGGIVFKNLDDINLYLKLNNLSKDGLEIYELINCKPKDIYKGIDNNLYLLNDLKIKSIS